jgi:hypothetical protein
MEFVGWRGLRFILEAAADGWDTRRATSTVGRRKSGEMPQGSKPGGHTMNLPRLIGIAVFSLLACIAGTSLADQTYMSFTFDDKTIDQPIGTGGSTVGEPEYISPAAEAVVRATPFDTPCLEIHNANPEMFAFVYFTRAEGGVSAGVVAIIMDLWFYGSGSGWPPYCEVYSQGYQTLLGFYAQADGRLHISSGSGWTDGPTIPVGRSFPVLIVLDMDADTFSVWMDETEWVSNQPLMATGKDFGRVKLAITSGCVPENGIAIDQLRVIDWIPDVSVAETTWGRVRALYR